MIYNIYVKNKHLFLVIRLANILYLVIELTVSVLGYKSAVLWHASYIPSITKTEGNISALKHQGSQLSLKYACRH